jgi:predicted double-glycine peptidase
LTNLRIYELQWRAHINSSIRQFVISSIAVSLAGPALGQPAPQPLSLIDVPYLSQSEALCGGAAAAMVLRFWGERGLTAESFAHLVDRSAAGIRTDALVGELRRRGWNATGIEGTQVLLASELAKVRPVLTLIEDRPGTYHYIVIVGATEKTVVFHDPARGPFRVVAREEFERRWQKADRWMAVVVPGEQSEIPNPKSEIRSPTQITNPESKITNCEARVADGVQRAQRNELEAAEAELVPVLGCPGALRELAGVRFLQQRWRDVEDLAGAAIEEDGNDAHAWRLLGTSRFLQNDPTPALDAWNRVGEPRVDLVSVRGLGRTRQRIVEQQLAVVAGQVLTPELITRASRRLDGVPAMSVTRLEYVPVSGGLAEIRATVVERPLLPSTLWSYAAVGAIAAARRELEISSASPSGGGELVTASWRFWPERPRVGIAVAAPAPWGGVWEGDGFIERQPFDAALSPSRRRSAGLAVSQWMTSRVRVTARAGADRWADAGSFGTADLGLRVRSRDERLDAIAGLAMWGGSGTFATASWMATLQSSRSRSGRVYIARTGAAVATVRTPADLWFGGDTGHARAVTLRAHPLLDDGALRVEQLGRQIVHLSAEAQHWRSGIAGVRFGGAVFLDSARVTGRLETGARGDVDIGLGARAAVPGLRGVFRLDVARGLRDGAIALSLVYEP